MPNGVSGAVVDSFIGLAQDQAMRYSGAFRKRQIISCVLLRRRGGGRH